MKVTGIVGSPRADGATTALVSRVLQGAREAGAETVLFNIQEAGVGGCMACYTCKDTGL
jgi:multimeric flavodoxin WrbA